MLVDSANHYPETFKALLQMPWVSGDEITVAETGAIHAIRWAAKSTPELSEQLLEASWVQDGVTEAESEVMDYIYRTSQRAPALAERMIQASWVQDGVTEAESEVMEYLYGTSRRAPELAQRMLEIPWMQDGLTKAESEVIDYSELIYRYDEDFALAILGMPFLRTLEFDDLLAVMAIHRLSRYSHDERLKALKEHPTLKDGITDDLTTLVAAAGTIREADEVERMLDPGYARIEVFTGRTELTPGAEDQHHPNPQ